MCSLFKGKGNDLPDDFIEIELVMFMCSIKRDYMFIFILIDVIVSAGSLM